MTACVCVREWSARHVAHLRVVLLSSGCQASGADQIAVLGTVDGDITMLRVIVVIFY